MTRSTKHPLTGSLMTIALVGSLSLAACGDDDDDRSSSFCEAAASYEAANSAPNPSVASPTELETAFGQLSDALRQLKSVAPSEIEADVDTVATVFENYIGAFAANDYDFTKLMSDAAGQEAMNALSSDEMGTALGNIEDYIATECATAPSGS